MAIRQVEERPRRKPRGTIRLGFKDDGDKGKLHNTEYFILTDAPDVQEAYGENPSELDIIFPSNIIEEVAPAYFEMWKGVRDRDGVMRGRLVCKGDGPSVDGTPGKAVWRDRESLPPTEELLGTRDPATGYINRVCYGDGAKGACRSCVNLKDHRGNPLCKPTLRLYVVLPRVSMYEFYLLTTHSWNTISDVISQLNVLQRMGVPINNRVFTLYKETQAATPWSESLQREFKTTINVVKMRENKKFMELYGDVVRDNIRAISEGALTLALPTVDQASLPPPAFEEEVLNAGAVGAEDVNPAKELAEEILDDPDIITSFRILEGVKGVTYSPKARLIAIRKKEKEPDVKAAVLAELDRLIQEAHQAKAPEAPEEVPEAPAAVIEVASEEKTEENTGGPTEPGQTTQE